MDLDTMDMDSDTMEDTMADSDTTARGLLMLRLSLILTMDTMDLDTPDTSDMPDSDTDSDTAESSTARGLLMLRLSLILTMDTMDLDTPDTSDMSDSDTGSDTAESSTANRLHQDLSVNNRQDFRQKWIVVSLKFPSPVLQFQCYHN